MDLSKPLVLTINKLWDGAKADANEWAEVTMSLTPSGLSVGIAARFHDNPAPDQAAGQTDELWNYEVVELFVANEKGEYLELEIGPHGHYLALRFSGVRNLVCSDIDIFCQTTIDNNLWEATAHVPWAALPSNINRANAFAIHDRKGLRRFLAAFPLPGKRPDFHQPCFFKPLSEISMAGD